MFLSLNWQLASSETINFNSYEFFRVILKKKKKWTLYIDTVTTFVFWFKDSNVSRLTNEVD